MGRVWINQNQSASELFLTVNNRTSLLLSLLVSCLPAHRGWIIQAGAGPPLFYFSKGNGSSQRARGSEEVLVGVGREAVPSWVAEGKHHHFCDFRQKSFGKVVNSAYFLLLLLFSQDRCINRPQPNVPRDLKGGRR